MKVMKIILHGTYRIRVDFNYDPQKIQQLKTIPDARWSKTLKVWHVPYTREAFDKLQELFPGISPNTVRKEKEMATKLNSIYIEITDKHIFIKLPKNESDIHFIRSFKYARWNMQLFHWIVPNYRDNAEKIKAFFEKRNPNITEYHSSVEKLPNEPEHIITKNEMLVVNNFRALKVYFSYEASLLREIKNIPYAGWNPKGSYWSIPASDKYLGELRLLAERFSLDYIYKEEYKSNVKPRTSWVGMEGSRECPPEYIAKLKELRYSKNTLDTYKKGDIFT